MGDSTEKTMPDHTKAGAEVTDAMVEAACRTRWNVRANINWDHPEFMKEEWRVEERRVMRQAIEAALKAAGGGA